MLSLSSLGLEVRETSRGCDVVQTGQMEESGHAFSLLLVFDEGSILMACRRATLQVGYGSLT